MDGSASPPSPPLLPFPSSTETAISPGICNLLTYRVYQSNARNSLNKRAILLVDAVQGSAERWSPGFVNAAGKAKQKW